MTPEEKKAREEERKLKALQNLQKRNALNALRVAKLKPKQSSFGWVYFQDPPDNKQPEIPTTLDKPLDVVKQVLATETEEQEQAIPAPEKIVQKDIGKEKTPPVKKLADSNGIIPEKSLKSLEDNERAQEIEKAQEKRDKLIAMMQNETLTAKVPDDSTQEKSNNTGEKETHGTTFVRGAYSENPTKKRNLIALTKGFVENLKNTGSDLIERDGDENIRPSLEEMRYINYEAKVNWHLQASWKQNFERSALYKPIEGHAAIEFTIDQNGNVVKSQLIKSTGHQELDTMIMKNLQFAQPFPPLPKHFGTTQYTTSRSIHVSCQKFKL